MGKQSSLLVQGIRGVVSPGIVDLSVLVDAGKNTRRTNRRTNGRTPDRCFTFLDMDAASAIN